MSALVDNFGIVGPLAVMAGGILLVTVHALVETIPRYFERAVADENPHSRSTVGSTKSDALDRSQVKRVCGVCGDVVSEAEAAKCGDCPGVGR